MQIRTSPSDLEGLRFYRRADDPDIERLLSRLRRKDEANEKMLAGSALHKWLETLGTVQTEALEIDTGEFQFRFDCGDKQIYLPKAREIKAEKVYQIGEDEITVAAVTDALDWLTVYDHKLTEKFDPEAYYLNSLQWRIYLDVFDTQRFVYNVFVGKKAPAKEQNGGSLWVIKDVFEFEIYRYPTLAVDIEMALADFASFAKEFLPERCK